MPYSYEITDASGLTAVFTVPFPKLSREHVHVSVDGIQVPDHLLVWLSEGQIQLHYTPVAGSKVRRWRSTPAFVSPVTFVPGRINAADLNEFATHMLYVAQEAVDASGEGYQVTDQILEYLGTLETTLAAALAAAGEATTAQAAIAIMLAEVEALAATVEAIAELNALGVNVTAITGLTGSNVQAVLEDIAAKRAADRLADVGKVEFWMRSTAPAGRLKANGAAVSRASYPELDTAIYCGDANNATASWGYRCTNPADPPGTRSTTGDYIVLLDARAEFFRGLDDGRGVDSGRILWSTQASAYASHTHTGTTQPGGDHMHLNGVGAVFGYATATDLGAGNGVNAGSHNTSASGTHTHIFTTDASGGTETRPRNVALLVTVKYEA